MSTGRWPARLVHGDLAAVDVLLPSKATNDGIRIVRWRAWGVGDPVWDIASLLSGLAADGSGSAVIEPAMGSAFWSSYSVDRSSTGTAGFLRRLGDALAVRLTNIVVDRLCRKSPLDRRSHELLRLAETLAAADAVDVGDAVAFV